MEIQELEAYKELTRRHDDWQATQAANEIIKEFGNIKGMNFTHIINMGLDEKYLNKKINYIAFTKERKVYSIYYCIHKEDFSLSTEADYYICLDGKESKVLAIDVNMYRDLLKQNMPLDEVKNKSYIEYISSYYEEMKSDLAQRIEEEVEAQLKELGLNKGE